MKSAEVAPVSPVASSQAPSTMVDTLHKLCMSPVDERTGRAIFEWYGVTHVSDAAHDSTHASAGGVWEHANLRAFLLDLNSAFDAPRIITDELLDLLAAEFQLQHDSAGRISWLEFKSFLILQNETPLYHLHQKLRSAGFSVDEAKRAVVISNLPTATTREVLCKLMFSDCSPERCAVVPPDAPPSLMTSGSGGSGVAAMTSVCMPNFTGTTGTAQAILVLKSAELIPAALAKTGRSFGGLPIKVAPYSPLIDFPYRPPPPKHGTVAKTLAPVVIQAQKAVGVVTALDAKLGLSSAIVKLNTDYHVTDTVGAAVGAAATSVSQKLQLKERTEALSAAVFRVPGMTTGWEYMSSLTTSAVAKISDLKADTMSLVQEKITGEAASALVPPSSEIASPTDAKSPPVPAQGKSGADAATGIELVAKDSKSPDWRPSATVPIGDASPKAGASAAASLVADASSASGAVTVDSENIPPTDEVDADAITAVQSAQAKATAQSIESL